MLKYETNIDTVALQLDFKNAISQRRKFSLLYAWIIGRRLGILKINEIKSNNRVKIYDLISGRSKLATLHTGFSKYFYIRIRFAGLKSFKTKHDNDSYKALMNICALLNTTGSNYKFVELDIALDLFCPFNRVLATCIRPVNNVSYNTVGNVQHFESTQTSYIEDFMNKYKRNNTFMRSYLYNKSSKEKLDFSVTRSELKLQNRFFLRNGFNLKSIVKALDKYAIFYFNSWKDKQYELNRLVNPQKLSNYELCKLEYMYIRVYHDFNVIEEFVGQINSVYVDFYGNVVIPPKTIKD